MLSLRSWFRGLQGRQLTPTLKPYHTLKRGRACGSSSSRSRSILFQAKTCCGFGAQGRAKGLGSVGLRVWHLGFRSVNVPSCYRFENSVSGLRFVAFRLLLSWFGISSLEFGFQGFGLKASVVVAGTGLRLAKGLCVFFGMCVDVSKVYEHYHMHLYLYLYLYLYIYIFIRTCMHVCMWVYVH